MAKSNYEKQRDANIARNHAVLKALELDKPAFEPKEKPRKPKTSKEATKRKAPPLQNEEPAPKALRVHEATESGSSVRRSGRNRGKTVDYNAEKRGTAPKLIAFEAGIRDMENEGPLGSGPGMRRTQNPKVYGHISGVEIGTWWETREGCSTDAIHAPWVGGISVGPEGAYSVALSGGYDDDVDVGYAFTYTGSGGRDLKGTKAAPKNLRTAPQSCDQDFENNFNKALKRSSETRKPVRVIRGFKLRSPYAPSEGYRYDGLYEVEKAWLEKGLNAEGYIVCKFAFKRLSGQPPLPRRDIGDGDGVSSDSVQEES